MDPNRLKSFGHSMGPSDRPYERLQPADHTGVCFAAAIGSAMHVPGSRHGEETGRRALAMLADGTAECICSKRRQRRHKGNPA